MNDQGKIVQIQRTQVLKTLAFGSVELFILEEIK